MLLPMPMNFLSRFCYGLIILLALTALPEIHAQNGEPTNALPRLEVPGERKVLASRLKFARKLVSDQKWTEAIDNYVQILHDVGDSLVPQQTPFDAAAASARSVQMRSAIHQDIAHLPPQALKLYRRRVAASTKRLLELGIKNRDQEALLSIVREAFCCEVGDKALDSLGDLAFERGDFHQALQWWRMVTALPSEAEDKDNDKTPLLRFPDPKIDVARTQAKMILALLFAGEVHGARSEFNAFKKFKKNQEKSGHLAGQEGNYSEILQTWLAKGPPDFGQGKSWSTFGGESARNRNVQKLPHQRLWVDSPTWRVPLPLRQAKVKDKTSTNKTQPARDLMFYPVITGNRILFSNGRSVFLLDLMTGNKLHQYSLPQAVTHEGKKTEKSPLPRYSLTVSSGRIYAILGTRQFGPVEDGKRQAVRNYLVCLDLKGGRQRLAKIWWQSAQAEKADGALFEAAPLVYGQRVYVSLSGVRGFQKRSSLLCFHAQTGEKLWETPVVAFPDPEENEAPVVRQPALTLAGRQLVYCSQAGLIIAVDAVTGKRSWAVRYPSRGAITIEGLPSPRDLAPCVYAHGKLYAAPMDSDRILCLDPKTGLTLWERDGIQVVHLLGCRRGKLIFTTRQGVRAVDSRTGNDKGGWVQPALGAFRLPPRGRGLLAGGWVFFPTLHPQLPLRLLHIDTGRQHYRDLSFPPQRLQKLVAGNMVFANGCLVVATEKELVGYVAPKHSLIQRQQDALGPKATAKDIYRLAQAEADAGLIDNALSQFRRAEKVADQKKLAGALRAWKCLKFRHALLLKAAEKAERSMNGKQGVETAAAYLEKAAGEEYPVALRLRAIEKLAELWARHKEHEKAVQTWQRILNDTQLKNGVYFEGTLPTRGKDEAMARIHNLTTKSNLPQQHKKTLIVPLQTPNAANGFPAHFAPDFGPPLVQAWRIPAGKLLCQHFAPHSKKAAEVFATAQNKKLRLHAAATGKVLWETTLPFAPAWSAFGPDRIVVAGEDGIAGLRLQDGDLLWLWSRRSGQSGVHLSVLPNDLWTGACGNSLSGFQCLHSSSAAPARICFSQGQRKLCVNSEDGRIIACTWPAGAKIRPLHQENPHSATFVSLGRGQRLSIKNARRIECLDLGNNRCKWTYTPNLPTTLSGELPHLFFRNEILLALIPRNYGYDLERIDPKTGKNIWKPAARLCKDTFDDKSIAIAQGRVYYVSGRGMYCRSLADGRLVWKRKLRESATPWRLERTRQALIVYPAPPKAELVLLPAGNIAVRLPLRERLVYPFALYVHDLDSGKELQKLDFGLTEDGGRLQFFQDMLVVTAHGTAYGIRAGGKKKSK